MQMRPGIDRELNKKQLLRIQQKWIQLILSNTWQKLKPVIAVKNKQLKNEAQKYKTELVKASKRQEAVK